MRRKLNFNLRSVFWLELAQFLSATLDWPLGALRTHNNACDAFRFALCCYYIACCSSTLDGISISITNIPSHSIVSAVSAISPNHRRNQQRAIICKKIKNKNNETTKLDSPRWACSERRCLIYSMWKCIQRTDIEEFRGGGGVYWTCVSSGDIRNWWRLKPKYNIWIEYCFYLFIQICHVNSMLTAFHHFFPPWPVSIKHTSSSIPFDIQAQCTAETYIHRAAF